MTGFLDKFTRTHRLKTFQAAKKAASKREGVAIEKASEKPQRSRAPREWPAGSLHARQTSILKWIEANGGKVDYR